ncbi:uncharacterized protein LOC113564898 [Drosophila persimilis]|uniref:uncharacterized protein LOC113564898 n=1 Tax=Drosophila persimilis TaxID=7234 RepID=UPI000F098628|nr:uncharacterized protein LOC113564898 [Drosophila persimilis]
MTLFFSKAIVYSWFLWFVQCQNVNGIRQYHLSEISYTPQTRTIRGEQVPLEFYEAIERSDKKKNELQHRLHHFLENLQKNLTTSTVFRDFKPTASSSENYATKMSELSTFFHDASFAAGLFAHENERFYDVIKNSSYALLLKLRQVPAAQPTQVKTVLTNYFSEMEFFHIMFSEIVDEALEYTVGTLRAVQRIFLQFADVQSGILQDWKLKLDFECCKMYMDFLQYHSAQVFKCAAGRELNVAYDVYAMTKINAKYIMRQLEFRIQRLFNCFIFKKYEIRCQFLQNAERDFESLFNKLEELEMYLDIKTKQGRASDLRFHRQSYIQHDDVTTKSTEPLSDCLPPNFPFSQIKSELRSCFYLFGGK